MVTRDDETIFDDELLWAELNRADGERKQAALLAMDALGELTMLRARARRLSYDEARRRIYDPGLLRADLRGDDDGLRNVAHRVRDQLGRLAALREADDSARDEGDQDRVGDLLAWIRDRLDHMRRVGGGPASVLDDGVDDVETP